MLESWAMQAGEWMNAIWTGLMPPALVSEIAQCEMHLPASHPLPIFSAW